METVQQAYLVSHLVHWMSLWVVKMPPWTSLLERCPGVKALTAAKRFLSMCFNRPLVQPGVPFEGGQESAKGYDIGRFSTWLIAHRRPLAASQDIERSWVFCSQGMFPISLKEWDWRLSTGRLGCCRPRPLHSVLHTLCGRHSKNNDSLLGTHGLSPSARNP